MILHIIVLCFHTKSMNMKLIDVRSIFIISNITITSAKQSSILDDFYDHHHHNNCHHHRFTHLFFKYTRWRNIKSIHYIHTIITTTSTSIIFINTIMMMMRMIIVASRVPFRDDRWCTSQTNLTPMSLLCGMVVIEVQSESQISDNLACLITLRWIDI